MLDRTPEIMFVLIYRSVFMKCPATPIWDLILVHYRCSFKWNELFAQCISTKSIILYHSSTNTLLKLAVEINKRLPWGGIKAGMANLVFNCKGHSYLNRFGWAGVFNILLCLQLILLINFILVRCGKIFILKFSYSLLCTGGGGNYVGTILP